MIVEITGPSGVGKSVYIGDLIKELSANGLSTGAIHSEKFNNCNLIPKYFSDIELHNIVTDMYALPWFLLFLVFNLRFCFFVLTCILLIDGAVGDKVAMFRSFVRKAGIYRFLHCKKFKKIFILVDEGLFHSAHNFLCSPNRCATDKKIRSFFKFCPLPEKILVLNASEEALLKRLTHRGDLSPRIRNEDQLVDFIKNARLLFIKLGDLCVSKGVGIVIEVNGFSGLNHITVGIDYIVANH
ncbi:MAG: hypothetical protein ACJ0BT_00805 [Pseudohongiellaceae bacterium]